MNPHIRHATLAATLMLLAAPAAAQTMDCERLREQIAGKFRAGGIAQPKLQVLDKDADTPGQVVGRCEQGSRKIVRLATAEAATTKPAAAASTARASTAVRRSADDDLLTECLDGSVQRGGDCGRRR
jgi:hypothetical protein